MNKKVFVFALAIIMASSFVNADVVSDVRTSIAQVMSDIPRRRRHLGTLWNYDVVFAANVSYCTLATVVSNDWRNALANLSRCATNQFERLLVLGVRDRFGAGFYLDFMEELVAMRTNGVISAKEFSWARSTEVPELERYLECHYNTPRVRTVVEMFKIAEPTNPRWDDVLSGVAYTNYLEEVSAGLW